jgi:hypothetical protein
MEEKKAQAVPNSIVNTLTDTLTSLTIKIDPRGIYVTLCFEKSSIKVAYSDG